MGDVVRFSLVMSVDRERPNSSAVLLFPQTRRRRLIDRAAARMRSLGPKQAEGYLITLLEHLQDDLIVAGIPEPVLEDQLVALALAIKAKAYPPAAASPGGKE